MSPPCVAFFEGNNFGSTHPGVTGSEITVLVNYNNGVLNNGEGTENGPMSNGSYMTNGFCDVENPRQSGPACLQGGSAQESTYVKWTRAFSRYFNERFQTYGRRVHMWVHWSVREDPEGARADAAEVYSRVKPFAVFDQSISGSLDNSWFDAMASRDVMVVVGGYKSRRDAAYFSKSSPNIWSFSPDVEHSVDQYVSYICRRVQPYRVSHAQGGVGQDGQTMNGRTRRYAFLSTTDPDYEGHQRFAELAKPALAKCGVRPEVDLTYRIEGPFPRFEADIRQRAFENVAAMRSAEVTTVIYLGGTELYTGEAADQLKYYPEVIFAGDGELERNYRARFQNQAWFRNAWGISHQRYADRLESDWGWKACREGDTTLTRGNCGFAAPFYTDYFMLFKAIQVAGPRLNPRTVDEGLHAIPQIASRHPQEASCYYDASDFSCVKDGIEEWWDPAGRVIGSGSPGCFRSIDGGRRYRAFEWPSGDRAFEAAPCNAYSGGGVFDQ